MLICPADNKRTFPVTRLSADFIVAGGGMAGVVAAITAAREGLKVVLVQDRPVLGGNASSEVRLWILGATAHAGNNNRWAREGGVINEILVENMYRNPEGNAPVFDTIVLEKVVEEPRITLLLNTAVFDVEKSDDRTIRSVRAFCSQNSTMYELHAPLFCDATGDGALGFLAGAAFRMGAESRDEFDEPFAPSEAFGELLGHSMYFYSRDTGKPVRFVAPSFAHENIEGIIPRYRDFNSSEDGCRLWWIEYGGRLDTVHDTEKIKWELWRVVYGVWDYIKNSGKFPEAANMTLEWVSTIPGKRESRRFEGDYILRQQDVVSGGAHYDAVSFGGWMIDLHPADGVYSEFPGCTHWQNKSIYQIPYRCLYSRNIKNLFLAGRIISVSHVAFGTTRVIGTCSNSAQAVAVAAVLCHETSSLPADLSHANRIGALQQRLLATGQHVPGLRLRDGNDIAQCAAISASSQLALTELPPSGSAVKLSRSRAQVLPVPAGRVPEAAFTVDIAQSARLRFELRTSSRSGAFTPDILLASSEVEVPAGEMQAVTTRFDTHIDKDAYLFYCLMANDDVCVYTSDIRVTGILSLTHNRTQTPPAGYGVDTFDLWLPERRPGGRNLALSLDAPIEPFAPHLVTSGIDRPAASSNAWVAAFDDAKPTIAFEWPDAKSVRAIVLTYDADWDHPMESVLMGHPESVMPFCVKAYRILDADGNVLAEEFGNHQARRVHELTTPVTTRKVAIEVTEVNGPCPAAIFGVRILG
ncbi:MAG: FAD-dependent oxidoreductase [Capsulimonadaceae bacterium]|nr:FAD-dependent oxidoreductase [Capsulimonadaceae bacterium]